jgi:hypothetical protein
VSGMACRENEPRRRARLRGIAGVVGLASLLPPLLAAGAAAQDTATLPPLQVVVLVDESGSLSEADVVREKEAARTIVFSVLAPNSVVSVVGFGSSNKAGQSAVDVVCQPTKLDASQKRDSLAQCVEKLHKRAPEEGNGTDHAAALQQALAFVDSGGPDKKVVFLLTDGKLDVSDSPSYGEPKARRNDVAQERVDETLAKLDSAGAQVWPFGFGDINPDALRGFARGESCTPAAPNPQARVTPTSEDLTQAVADAFSSASCVKYIPPKTDHLPSPGSVEFVVDLPTIASDASIVVYKQDPRVQVEYRTPSGQVAVPGGAGGTTLELSGQATPTESLHIIEPEPGKWTIRLSAAADVPPQDVAATVAYQAAVRASLTVSPPQPAAGQTVEIDMDVRAQGHAITDSQSLQGLTFVTTMTGSSGFSPQEVKLADPDQDGTFTGQLKVPDDASGDLLFTGRVTGIGIGGDTREFSTRVQDAAAAIQGQIQFDSNRAAVTPGGTVAGSVLVTNNSGQPARLRLEIANPSEGTVLTVDPAIVQAAVGSSRTAFTLRFGADSAVGASSATVRLVDDANPSVVVTQRLFANDVAPEPGLGQRLFWLWVVLAVLLAGALLFLFVRLRARSNASKVRGLKAQLLQSGFVKSELEPREPNGKVFRFVLHEDFTGLQLQHAGPGEANVYEVRRAGTRISFTPPGQQPVLLVPGERHEIGQDLAIAVFDERGMAGAGETLGGPVTEVSFNPFGAPASGGSFSGPPAGPSAGSHGDPFAGAGAPGSSTQAPPTDPFVSSYGDPFAGAASQAPTATYPTAGSGRPNADPYQGDPFGDDPFGNGPPDARQRNDDPTRRSPAPPSNDAFFDPNNPFS